jgi:hypothetical protein
MNRFLSPHIRWIGEQREITKRWHASKHVPVMLRGNLFIRSSCLLIGLTCVV